RDDLVGPGHPEVEAPPAGHARDVAAEQRDGAAIRRELAGDEVEQRRLAGAVGADDEPALARIHDEVYAGGDAQAAERLVEGTHGQRGHRRPGLSHGLDTPGTT